MKPISFLKAGLLCLAAAALVTGCCRSMNCDCVFPSIGVFYESDTLPCPNDFRVTIFNQATNENLGEPLNLYTDGCVQDFSFESNRYWVISSDSLDISDTLRIVDIAFFDPKNKCCDCGPQISDIEIDLNGERSAGNAPVRKY